MEGIIQQQQSQLQATQQELLQSAQQRSQLEQQLREAIANLRQVVQVRHRIHDFDRRQSWCADVDAPEEWAMRRLYRAQVVNRLV